jgi:hypothetical protein
VNDVLLAALACGATVEAAAQRANVSRATVLRRLRDPEFKRKLTEMGTEMVQRTASALTAASMESVRTLIALQQPTVAAATRLGAARSVIELGIKLREVADLAERLTALEQHVAVNNAMQ